VPVPAVAAAPVVIIPPKVTEQVKQTAPPQELSTPAVVVAAAVPEATAAKDDGVAENNADEEDAGETVVINKKRKEQSIPVVAAMKADTDSDVENARDNTGSGTESAADAAVESDDDTVVADVPKQRKTTASSSSSSSKKDARVLPREIDMDAVIHYPIMAKDAKARQDRLEKANEEAKRDGKGVKKFVMKELERKAILYVLERDYKVLQEFADKLTKEGPGPTNEQKIEMCNMLTEINTHKKKLLVNKTARERKRKRKTTKTEDVEAEDTPAATDAPSSSSSSSPKKIKSNAAAAVVAVSPASSSSSSSSSAPAAAPPVDPKSEKVVVAAAAAPLPRTVPTVVIAPAAKIADRPKDTEKKTLVKTAPPAPAVAQMAIDVSMDDEPEPAKEKAQVPKDFVFDTNIMTISFEHYRWYGMMCSKMNGDTYYRLNVYHQTDCGKHTELHARYLLPIGRAGHCTQDTTALLFALSAEHKITAQMWEAFGAYQKWIVDNYPEDIEQVPSRTVRFKPFIDYGYTVITTFEITVPRIVVRMWGTCLLCRPCSHPSKPP